MVYVLSYVNFKDGTETHYDMSFDSLTKLLEYVDTNHEGISSYQIIAIQRSIT